MTIHYATDAPVTASQFIELLEKSTLAERRPVADKECIEGLLANSNLVVTAWLDEELVGIARCMTDFHYACYLSDLAVSAEQQNKGVGRQLIAHTRQQLGPRCKLVLVAAPAANDYYAHIGFANNPRCWILEPGSEPA